MRIYVTKLSFKILFIPISPCINGHCVNSEGSYACLCDDGFQKSDSNDDVCKDINECQNDADLCQTQFARQKYKFLREYTENFLQNL